MTRAELIALLEASGLTEAQRAKILADFDAGRIATVEQAVAAIAALKPKRGGGGYIYDPATRRYTTPSELGPRPERPTKPTRPAKPKPLMGRIIARVKQYAQAARGTYETVRGRVAALAGYTEEMRVLHGTDHCSASELPGCVESSGHWAPIGTLPRIGRCTCRNNCRCTFRYRRTA